MTLFEIVGKVALDGVPKSEKELKNLSETGEESSSKLSKFSGVLSTVGKGIAIVGASAMTGAIALGKIVTGAYGQYEQLVGGVETLFKDSAGDLMKYADNSFKTAGMSANEYMQLATSFSASLLQSLGGDTEKAVKYTDMAITDMSDNANKMGTNMEMIQNAYNGFAKQNYMMLDNLKLGYGGTKTEMQRLLADAEKISGIHYDISSYADIVDAIHIIQTEMGITGTTAEEAEHTIEGSMNTLKGAWQNLLVGFGNSKADITKLCDDVATAFVNVINNVTPIIENIAKSIPTAIKGLADILPTMFTTLIPSLLSTAVEIGKVLVQALVDGITKGIPWLLEEGTKLITKISEGVASGTPNFINKMSEIVGKLCDTLTKNAPAFIKAGVDLIFNLIRGLAEGSGALRDMIGNIVDIGLDLITNLVSGIIDGIPTLIETIPTIVSNLAGIINDNAPKLILTGVELIGKLAWGLIQAIPTLIANIPKIIKAIVDVFFAFNWLKMGKSLITAIKNGFVGENPVILNAVKNILNGIVDGLKSLPSKIFTLGKNAISGLARVISGGEGISGAVKNIVNVVLSGFTALPRLLVNVGKNLVQGLWNGINNAKDWVLGKIKGFGKSILNGIKSFFGIKSPSRLMRDEVGKYLAEGIGVGIEEDDTAENSMREKAKRILGIASDSLSDINVGANVGANVNSIIGESPMQKYQLDFNAQLGSLNNGFNTLVSLVGSYLPNIADGMDRNIVLDSTNLTVGISKKMDMQLGKMTIAKGRGNV